MAQNVGLEPFPSPRNLLVRQESSTSNPGFTVRRRRKSSNLPEDPRGDTGGIAVSTWSDGTHEAAPLSPRAPGEKRHSKRRKARTFLRRWKSISLRHTWVNPFIVSLIVLVLYGINPGKQNPLHAAIFLSYPLPRPPETPASTPIQYGKGGQDFAFVAFYMVVLSFSREFLMQRVMRPIAIRAGLKSRAKQSRFMEQFYTAIYFGIFGPYGLYVMSRTPMWYFKTTPMFEGYPHKSHEASFKAYYLLQAAYWAQQAVVLLLQLEKPRKDFKELVGHHVVTVALIWLSYRFHFTYLGLAVYITHDVSDYFLATSKLLNYLDSQITIPYFGFFVFVWAYCRHYLNLQVLWAVLTEFRTVGPFELNWETQHYKFPISQYITFSLLASLQSVNIFWFFLILRIALRYVFEHQEIEDDRSEYGTEDEVEEGSTSEKTQKMLAKGVNVKTERPMERPTVLLNGMPVNPGSPTLGATSGRTVEVMARERRNIR